MTTLTLTKTPAPTEAPAPTRKDEVLTPPELAVAVESAADEMLLASAKRAKPGRVKGSRQARTVRGWSMGGRVD